MRISVITPTRNRDDRLRTMYRCFAQQTWPDRELLILDDSPQPSPFFTKLSDPQVIYRHLTQPLVLGEKRNRLVAYSSGDFIAHFDDDDLYAPDYLTSLMKLRGEADFFTLSGWFARGEKADTWWYWDTERILPYRYAVSGVGAVPQIRSATTDKEQRGIELNLWGYGFSYLYKKAVWETNHFPPVGFGEDYAFAKKVAEQGFKRAAAPDTEGLALHILHGTNSSGMYPQFALPPFLIEKLFGSWLPGLLPRAP
jgi:glycosyltransferase involved in cell wall biosynthesis